MSKKITNQLSLVSLKWQNSCLVNTDF